MLKIVYFIRDTVTADRWYSIGSSVVDINTPLPLVGDSVTIPKYDVHVQVEQRCFDYTNCHGGVTEVYLYFTFDPKAIREMTVPTTDRTYPQLQEVADNLIAGAFS